MRNELKNYRNKIDIIDKKISKLIEKRFLIVEDISIYKKKNNIKIQDKKREKEVFNNIKVKSKKINLYINSIYKLVLKLSRKNQK